MPHYRTGFRSIVTWPMFLRTLKFASVGAFCFVIQYLLLVLLVDHVMPDYRTPANAIAFMISAQVNFLLSRSVTWRDRMSRDSGMRFVLRQGVMYNATAILSLAVNSMAFWLVDYLTGSLFLAVSFGNGVGMIFTFLVLNRLVFHSAVPIEEKVY